MILEGKKKKKGSSTRNRCLKIGIVHVHVNWIGIYFGGLWGIDTQKLKIMKG